MKRMLLDGLIRVEYEGRIPDELEDYLETAPGVRVVIRRPLVLAVERPEVVVNEAMPFLASALMKTRRIHVRPAREDLPFPVRAYGGCPTPTADECA